MKKREKNDNFLGILHPRSVWSNRNRAYFPSFGAIFNEKMIFFGIIFVYKNPVSASQTPFFGPIQNNPRSIQDIAVITKEYHESQESGCVPDTPTKPHFVPLSTINQFSRNYTFLQKSIACGGIIDRGRGVERYTGVKP
jgi:hypothetical protein